MIFKNESCFLLEAKYTALNFFSSFAVTPSPIMFFAEKAK